jgi:hypothetical protein
MRPFSDRITLQFKFATNPETRRRASAGFEDRLAINEPLLSKALDLRRKLAKLLKYDTWADFVTEEKMVKSANNVFKVGLSRLPLADSCLMIADPCRCLSSWTISWKS